MKIVFFGSSSYVIPIVETLNKNFNLVLVITTEKSPTEPVISCCKKNNINYLSVSSLSDSTLKSQLLALDSALAVVADFGLIIPKNIMNLFPDGMLNIHPSLLPKYTILKVDDQVDHGPIFAQTEELIKDTDTSQLLYKRLFKIGADLLPNTINKYVNEKIKLQEQDHSEATFTKMLTRQDGFVDLAKEEKSEIARKIRAYYPWPGVWTDLDNRNKKLRIKLLPNNKLQVEGKKPISYKDFINGYPEAKKLLKNINQ